MEIAEGNFGVQQRAFVQFADFSCKILQNAHEIYKSMSGQSVKSIHYATLSRDLQVMAEDVNRRVTDVRGPSAAIFQRLCQDCRGIHLELVNLIEKTRRDAKHTNKISIAAKSFSAALVQAPKAEQIDELVSRVAGVRQ